MNIKNLLLPIKGLVLLALVLFCSNSSFAQKKDCASGGPDTLKLTGIGPVKVTGTTQRAKAIKAYKKGLAKAAQGEGSCGGSCVVGECMAFFKTYTNGSSNPQGSSGGGNYTFDPPSNKDSSLTFVVVCDCTVSATKVDIEILYTKGEQSHEDQGGKRAQNSPTNHSAYLFFPNPTVDQINLRADLTSGDAPVIIRLTNLQGQVVLEENLGTLTEGKHQFGFDIQGLTPGVYIGLIQSDGKILGQSRIIVQR